MGEFLDVAALFGENVFNDKVMQEKLPKNIALHLAMPKYCTDNAAMVGGVAWHAFRKGDFKSLDIDSFARLPQIVSVPFADVKK